MAEHPSMRGKRRVANRGRTTDTAIADYVQINLMLEYVAHNRLLDLRDKNQSRKYDKSVGD
jgi:hypothetical protein